MKPTKVQLDIINSRLPEHRLSEQDVEVLPFMVFDAKLTDRYTVMSQEMMNKLALDLNQGKAAFNKLHESRSELPVGASVSGRVITEPTGERQLQAMMYAVTKRPDGTPFEEGKDLVDRYKTGAVRACSAGVSVGFYKCNICGNDVRSWNDCEHIPGKKYTKDEQPITCVALMTGHSIVNGVAEDCGIYEVSAVTAGGVAAAGAMTEAFGRYDGGVDPKEFKKAAFTDKGIEMRLEFSAAPNTEFNNSSEEEKDMTKEEVQSLLAEHYDPLKQANEKLKSEYDVLQGAHTKLAGEFEAATAELVELKKAATVSEEAYAAQTAELEAAKSGLTAITAFKAEYIANVLALGIKAGETVTAEEFEAKTVEELKALSVVYTAKIEALPVGQLTSDGQNAQTFAALDDSCYKS